MWNIIIGPIENTILFSLVGEAIGSVIWPAKVDYSGITPEEIQMAISSSRLAIVFNVAIGIGMVATVVIVGDYFSFWTY